MWTLFKFVFLIVMVIILIILVYSLLFEIPSNSNLIVIDVPVK